MPDLINFQINIHCYYRNGIPTIELRRLITKPDTIKAIVSAAFHDKPIMVLPTFNNRLQALATLCEKNILKYKNGKYEFKI